MSDEDTKFGQGLPPAGGWKRYMTEPDEYSPEYQDEYRRLWQRDAERLRVAEQALRRIAEQSHADATRPGSYPSQIARAALDAPPDQRSRREA